jgi:hypothetical protein
VKLRLRVHHATDRHVRVIVFEGREHGPRLGELVFDRARWCERFGPAAIRVGLTIEVGLEDAGEVVR